MPTRAPTSSTSALAETCDADVVERKERGAQPPATTPSAALEEPLPTGTRDVTTASSRRSVCPSAARARVQPWT
jgi:hypothetical protein